MSESEASSRTNAGDEPRSRSQGNGGGALQSEHGQTKIGEGVVTKVAGIAAREVPGVHDLGGGAERALGSMSQKVGIAENRKQGVSVETGEKEAAVDLSLVIDYGESIPRIAEAVRNQVIKRVEGITGLRVTEVNIVVNDLYFPGDHESEDEESRVS